MRHICFLMIVGAACIVTACDRDRSADPSRLFSPDFSKRPLAIRPPTGVDAIPMLSYRVDVFWKDSSTNETGFRVELSIDSGASWRMLAVRPANSVALVDTGRTSEQRVCYRVIALVDAAESQPSTSDCTTPPAAPTNLVAADAGAQDVALTWSDNSGVEDGYYITRWPNGDQSKETLIAEPAANATSYRDTGLQSGVSYSYRVRLKKDHGFGSNSNIATVTPGSASGPKAPSGLVAAATFMDIALRWTDNSNDEDGFYVERLASPNYEWQRGFQYAPNTTTAGDQALSSADQQIVYRVWAFNKGGQSVSNEASAWVLNPPENVAATLINANTIDITWTNRSRFANGVEIQRGPTSAGPFTVIATPSVTANASTYRDAGLAANATYWYMVRFRIGASVSDAVYAFASSATTPPNAPAGLKVQPFSSSSILGWWQSIRTSETGYRLEQSPDGGASWTTVQTLYPGQSGFSASAATERAICLRLIAFNDYAESVPSNVACTTPPAAATELAADTAHGVVLLSWRDNSNVEDGYLIARSTQMDESSFDIWEYIGQVGANVTTFRDSLPPTSSGYALYSVQPIKDGGTGDGSEAIFVGLPSSMSEARVGRALHPSGIQRRGKPSGVPRLPQPRRLPLRPQN